MRSIIIFIIVLIAALYSGCGNDTSTGNNNNPPATRDSLIASFDSLSSTNFIAPYSSSFAFSDTLYIKKFSVSFKVTSNLDTTNGSYLKFLAFHNSDTTNYYSILKSKTEMNSLSVNGSFSFNTSTPFHFYALVVFGFNQYPIVPERTITVRDFRLNAVID